MSQHSVPGGRVAHSLGHDFSLERRTSPSGTSHGVVYDLRYFWAVSFINGGRRSVTGRQHGGLAEFHRVKSCLEFLDL